MKIEGTPEEIAVFVIAVQGRQNTVDEMAGKIAEGLSAAFSSMPLTRSPASDSQK